MHSSRTGCKAKPGSLAHEQPSEANRWVDDMSRSIHRSVYKNLFEALVPDMCPKGGETYVSVSYSRPSWNAAFSLEVPA